MDVVYSAMTDEQLVVLRQDAQFCLALAQTKVLRTRFMAIVDAIKAEQQRRSAQ